MVQLRPAAAPPAARHHPDGVALGYSPFASRSASASGSPASRISACVFSMSYGMRRKWACPLSRSIRRYAARGSPSRGWPTEPGLSSQRPVAELDLAAALREAAGERVPAELEGDRDVAVADEHERCGRVGERLAGDVLAEHVLPDRVARAGVEELDAGPLALRLERLEELARLGLEHVGRPGRARRRVGGEVRQLDPPDRGEVVVPDEAQGRTLARLGDAAVRLGAVPDDVPEAPDLVDRILLDVGENGRECVPVAVDVGDDSDSHLASGLQASRPT